MSKIRSKGKRKDISLMTLLANEATGDSRKLLKKYGEKDAIDYQDLEGKLSQLYLKTDDKVKLEKDLADIHPHKKWLLRNTEPIIEVKKEEVIISEKKEEPKQNFDGDCRNPNCPYCQMRMMQGFSNVNGNQDSSTRPMDYVGVIGMVAVVGALFYVLTKNK